MNSSSTISSAINYVTISTTGVITILVQTTAWTVGFGLPFDQVIEYLAA